MPARTLVKLMKTEYNQEKTTKLTIDFLPSMKYNYYMRQASFRIKHFSALVIITTAAMIFLVSGCGLLNSEQSKGVFGQENAFALDSSGKAHTIYSSPTGLKYATNKTGPWAKEILSSNRTNNPSLAIDQSGYGHVVYYDSTLDSYMYATNMTESWEHEVILADTLYNYSTSLILNSSQVPHITFTHSDANYADATLLYATKTNEAWNIVTPIENSSKGIYSTIGVDVNNDLYIAYLNPQSRDILLARTLNGTWTSEAIINTGEREGTIDLVSMAVLAPNSLAITYNDHNYRPLGGNSILKYTTNESSSWSFKYIDLYATSVSMARGTNGTMHVMYKRSNEVKYATNASGSWNEETLFVDSGDVGLISYGDISLSIDNNEKLHAVYYEDTSRSASFDPIIEGRLNYISNTTGTWEKEVVDSGN